ncbi:MAG TPA: RodZ domain-containing protein [Steroidobacteraceae bacterium]|nr:RodZ domain-containing protein [Steroidobacteraceae bacterium]
MSLDTPTAPSGIGARLKAARERSGLSLLQAAEKLHLDPDVIAALEEERFEELGADVYVRGHLRRYAELVHEDPLALMERYRASAGEREPDLRRVPRPQSLDRPSALRTPGLLIAVAVGLIGLAWWVQGSLRSAHPRAVPQALASGPATAAQAPPAVPPAAVAPPAVAPVPAAPPSRAAASPRPAATASVARAAAAATGTLSPVRASLTGAPADGPATAVRLAFSADSWVEVYDAHGERLTYGLAAARSVRAVSGSPPLRVVLGNAPAAALEVDGHAVVVPSAGERAGRVEFRIDRSGGVMPAHLEAAGRGRP